MRSHETEYLLRLDVFSLYFLPHASRTRLKRPIEMLERNSYMISLQPIHISFHITYVYGDGRSMDLFCLHSQNTIHEIRNSCWPLHFKIAPDRLKKTTFYSLFFTQFLLICAAVCVRVSFLDLIYWVDSECKCRPCVNLNSMKSKKYKSNNEKNEWIKAENVHKNSPPSMTLKCERCPFVPLDEAGNRLGQHAFWGGKFSWAKARTIILQANLWYIYVLRVN